MSDQPTLAGMLEGKPPATEKDSSKGGTVSEGTDSMDQLVQAASVPSLATLFQRGKDAGLLKAVTGYSSTG